MKKTDLLKPIAKEKMTSHKAPRQVIIVFISLLATGLAVIAFVFIISRIYNNRIFPGTRVGSVYIGGKSLAEAQQLLQPSMDTVADSDFIFLYNSEHVVIPSSLADETNPELSAPLLVYNAAKTVSDIMEAQRHRSEAERVFYWLTGWQASPSFQIDEQKIEELLTQKLDQYQQPATNAGLAIGPDNVITITPEKSGQAFDYSKILNELKNNIQQLSVKQITVTLEEDQPGVSLAQAEQLRDLVGQVLAAAPFRLVYGDRSWELTADKIRDWLEFQSRDGRPTAGLNRASLANYLQSIASEINVPLQEGKFSMQDGKVVNFEPSQSGLELQIAASADMINKKIVEVGVTEIDLTVQETKPATTTDDINNLGIKELIGEGHSNFKGSPTNRRHNISVGAGALNGILIKPGEEFSLVKTLGKIEASTGYLPELVIKGNKTTPEYGGGLCQIGTTTFRAALDAGLPITARTNHSYRVSYYEPAGTDATIYDPQPDLKFVNDTGHYILFTTEMTSNDLYFRFYGTRDGRTVTQTTPRIFNYVKPGAAKLVETTDLKPGEKKCTEKAHTGADAEFTRTIIYASGEKKVDVFKSHYKPWQEVCLIGVEKLSSTQKK
jgi:vancomycin resistance protein YoaR